MFKNTFSALAFTALLGFTTSAKADLVNLPGSSCQALSGTASIDDSGRLLNKSTSTTLTVLCPVPQPYGSDLEGYVYVIDQHTSSNITCTPYAYNTGGGKIAGTGASTSGYSNSYKTLTLSGPVYSYTFTSRYYVCSIPVMQNNLASGILLYRGETF